jgi:hypothetical protein
MAKILVKKQDVFADLLSATGNIAQFGSMKAAAAAYSKDLDTIQALDAFAAGWTGAVSSGPPYIEDLNGLFYLLTTQLAYLNQTSIPEWNASATYYIGSLVNDGADVIYMSGVNDNTNNALTDGTKWHPIKSKKSIIITSLPYTVLNSDNFITVNFTPTVTDNGVVLPTPSAINLGRKVTVKQIAVISAANLIVRTADASTIDGSSSSLQAQYTAKSYTCDGTNWFTS